MQHFTMAPHRGSSGAPTNPGGSPNAALLIDFDNVTMGIRSDLTRQLKELLNSDIIKGKVAVQRAYADWRRYAQYIVPLSEASVDLIFAPAYGSSKKNATDIRLAIDALELVFTRPEIGTYILLSGDSDFSSLVLKLKEYGKYVIGVGLRESASDLLVQNCDEYFSYSSLTGLTRAGDEGVVPSVDAWDLVERAINQMAADDDVMRSDRLKQVMVELDPTFDEGVLGFTKFNKFLTEAASRNRLALKKLENGQYEVQPFEHGGAESREERPHGRGRRDRKEEPRRESREQRESRGSREPREPRERAQADSAAPSRGRGEPRAERPRQEAAPSPEPRREAAKPAARPVARDRREEQIGEAYELLRRAVRELASQPGEAVRDSDIKRKMLEIEPGWDESTIGFTKFSRFLRQAHDAEVVDLSRHADGFFEARLSRSSGRTEAPRKDRDRGRDRDRDRDRDNGREGRPRGRGREERAAEAPVETPSADAPTVEAPAVEAKTTETEVDTAIAGATQATEAADRSRPRDRGGRGRDERRTAAVAEAASAPTEEPTEPAAQAQPPAESADTPAEAGTQATAPAPKAPAAKPAGFGRRGRRGGAADGPPPLLPGQVVGGADGAPTGRSAAAERDEADVAGTDIPAEPAPEPEVEATRTTGSPGETPAESGAGRVDAHADAPADAPAEEPAEQPAARQQAPVAREAPGVSLIDSEALGLPTDRGAVIRYLSNSYQGVGQKTAESLIDAFGEDRVFQGLNDEPDRVREILGAGRRTDALLNAWQRDLRRRSTGGTGGTDPSGNAPSGA
jgi:uncharacterized protein (TIGR00288 family)